MGITYIYKVVFNDDSVYYNRNLDEFAFALKQILLKQFKDKPNTEFINKITGQTMRNVFRNRNKTIIKYVKAFDKIDLRDFFLDSVIENNPEFKKLDGDFKFTNKGMFRKSDNSRICSSPTLMNKVLNEYHKFIKNQNYNL